MFFCLWETTGLRVRNGVNDYLSKETVRPGVTLARLAIWSGGAELLTTAPGTDLRLPKGPESDSGLRRGIYSTCRVREVVRVPDGVAAEMVRV